MGDDVSSWRRQGNGLPSGLCPISDIVQPIYQWPSCRCRFIYADDICCALQAETFSEIECTLTADLARLAKYYQLRRLKPSTSKTVTSVFHLHNNRSRCELNVHMNCQRLKQDPCPVYLDLSRSAAKLKSRNNLIVKLAGTS